MRRIASRLVLSVLAALSLASCGGGGDDDGEPPPPGGGSGTTISGTVRFARVPFHPVPGQGLDYATPVMQPARGVAVRALHAGTQAVLASGTTSATGTRASGPFAILDTLYTVIQSVLTLEPQVNLPALLVDWGSQ